MATLTVRNIDNEVKERLRVQAARHGRSMEEEVRAILKRAVGGIDGAGLWELSRQLFEDRGVSLELPSRASDRAAMLFDPSEHE
ncbi:hypothetical protein P7B02_02080 [Caulobacter segnis]|uniref:FitA-like ribbon-helix-helix domain-containing protein n=1 Tax=Caulobacter segnis TaxID=88688 RepID=UPI0024104EFC|nr:hypothetical protein [Caulobacter segnis]MDG2520314.1 hypothetical protein [Caulobacter segnis]